MYTNFSHTSEWAGEGGWVNVASKDPIQMLYLSLVSLPVGGMAIPRPPPQPTGPMALMQLGKRRIGGLGEGITVRKYILLHS